MNAIRTVAAMSLAALATACASPDATPAAGMSPGMSHGGAPMPMAAMEPRMKAMKDMQQKMMAAKSPAERQALMADHMKAMQEGMAMMKEMHGGMQGMGARHGVDIPARLEMFFEQGDINRKRGRRIQLHRFPADDQPGFQFFAQAGECLAQIVFGIGIAHLPPQQRSQRIPMVRAFCHRQKRHQRRGFGRDKTAGRAVAETNLHASQ